MKRKALLLLLAAIPLFSFAQQDKRGYDNQQQRGNYQNNSRDYNRGGYDANCESGSALTVYSENGERFLLIINGVKQNNYADSRIRVEGLPQVANDIQIIFDDNFTPALNRRLSFIDPVEGRAVAMTLRIERDRSGRPRLSFQKLTSLERDYRAEHGEHLMRFGNDNYRDNRREVVRETSTPPPPPPPQPMDRQSFAAAVQTIKKTSFDDTKLSTAQSIANNNFFTTDQVIEICRLFSFSDSKLSFAKYAFKRTIDNANYFKVNTVFSFDSDRQSLNDYVNANR